MRFAPRVAAGAALGLLVAIAAAAVGLNQFKAANREPSPEAEPPLARAALAADKVLWSFAAPLFDGAGQPESYTLQAASLADERPTVAIEVPYATGPDDLARYPAVSAPIDGAVVYVADDGTSSSIRRISIRPDGAPESLSDLADVVWDLAVAPGGDVAYAALRSRVGDDRGVVAVALDGSGEIEPLVGPAAHGAPRDGVALAAMVTFDVRLQVSSDGNHLMRMTCAEGRCGNEVIDLRTGERTALDQLATFDIVGGVAFGERCPQAGSCELTALDLRTGNETPVTDMTRAALVTIVDGDPVVVVEDRLADDGRVTALRAVNAASGESHVLMRLVPDQELDLRSPSNSFDFQLGMPPGWIVVTAWSNGVQHQLVIDVVSGDRIEAPPPAFVLPFGGVNG